MITARPAVIWRTAAQINVPLTAGPWWLIDTVRHTCDTDDRIGIRLWEDPAVLETDESYRSGAERLCECCGQPSRRTWCMINRDGRPYALFFAACYDHGGERESWIDVVFGTWGQGTDHDDHVTFGCRFGPGAGSEQPGATAVDAAAVAPDSPLYGHKLTRAEALAHPRLGEFWQVIDFVVETDPLVHRHHYGHPAAPNC